jgi:hypothetical protein
MGDRCYLEMSVAEVDLPKLKKIVGDVNLYDDGKEKGIANIVEDEVNYGWVDELQKLAERCVAFYGWHGEGNDYGSSSFCGLGGKIYWMRTSHGEDVTEFDNGRPVDDSVRIARLFYEAWDAAERMVKKRAQSEGGG